MSLLYQAGVGPDRVKTQRVTEPTRNGKRRPRELKTYKNPHTNEFVQTKGGNNRVLNEWKAEYGAEAVKSWLQS